jgi:hypothetical protein
MVNRHRKRFSGCTAYNNFALESGHVILNDIVAGHDVVIPGTLIRNSLFTEPLVPCVVSMMDDKSVSQAHYLSELATRFLWH